MCIAHRNTGTFLGGNAGRMAFSEPGVKPHYGPSRAVRITHMKLALSLEPVERGFSGTATMTIEAFPTFEGASRYDLDQVNVVSVTDTDGNELEWTHDDAVVEVEHSADVGSIRIAFQGDNPIAGLYFTGPTAELPDRQYMAWTQCQDEDGHFVFPCHDHPRFKHAWSIELDAPAGYTLLSNGTCEESGERDGRAFARYEQVDPMPAYLFTAVAAKLSVVSTTWRDRPVRYLVPVGQEEAVLRSMGKTPLMIEHFSQLTGRDYAWPRYDQVVVHDFIFGGMENTGCTTMLEALLVDEKAIVEWDPEGLVAHELAHQWFGDLVTCQDWSQAWLNESWATFMEQLWWEHDRSKAEATWYRWGLQESYLGEDGGRYRRPIVSYDFKEPIDVFDRHLYEKGACVLGTLRTMIGEKAFWTGVSAYLDANAHGTVHTRLFQRSLEEATGANLDQFFHQWIHGAGHPDVNVKLAAEKNQLTVVVSQSQSGERTAEAFAFPLTIEVVSSTGKTQSVTLDVREKQRTWVIPTRGKVKTVRIDAGLNILANLSVEAPRGWLEALLADDCPVVAVRAARALAKEGSPKAFAALEAALAGDAFHGVRSTIATLIGKRGGEDSLAALTGQLASESEPRVRRAIATALGSYRRTEAADALLAVVNEEDPQTWHLLGAALVGLAKTGDARAIDAVTAHLDTKSWADFVRVRAMVALGHTRSADVVDTVMTRTRAPFSSKVRAGGAMALGQLADDNPDLRKPCVERLVEMLKEPGFRTQLATIDALAKAGDAAAIPALSQVHRSAPDGRTRRKAYEALYVLRKGRTSEEGLQGLRDSLEAMRSEHAKLRTRIDKIER
ncbi:MAG: M1 family metallopeptidase [Proteobacteria bacterium]|nr:M1 family metallopeptidase [Pseudomonadota bacterium]